MGVASLLNRPEFRVSAGPRGYKGVREGTGRTWGKQAVWLRSGRECPRLCKHDLQKQVHRGVCRSSWRERRWRGRRTAAEPRASRWKEARWWRGHGGARNASTWNLPAWAGCEPTGPPAGKFEKHLKLFGREARSLGFAGEELRGRASAEALR